MSERNESGNYQLLPKLPEKLCGGLKELWLNSVLTGTEWIGAIMLCDNKPELVILGHELADRVIVPIIHPSSKYYYSWQLIEDIHAVKLESSYQGKILFLNSSGLVLEDGILDIIQKEGIINDDIKNFLGLAHTHPLRTSLGCHLPSFPDTGNFVFKPLEKHDYEIVVAKKKVSCLVRTLQTPDYKDNPDRYDYYENQKTSDNLNFDLSRSTKPNRIAFREVLKNNCIRYHLNLYQGTLTDADEEIRLSPVFKS